jgi:aspartate oxidase
MEQQYDVIIVGAGLAGLRAAIELGQDALRPVTEIQDNKGSERIGDIQSDMQEIMMRHVSVFRQAGDLQKTLDVLEQLKERYTHVRLTDAGSHFNRERMDYLELGYMLDLAQTITMGALWRQESGIWGCKTMKWCSDVCPQGYPRHTLPDPDQTGGTAAGKNLMPTPISGFKTTSKIYIPTSYGPFHRGGKRRMVCTN